MGHCKACEYWEPGEGWFCQSDRGYCNQPTGGEDQPVKPERGQGGHGEPGDPGRLKTGPNYGCIHFIKKVG